MNTKPLNALYVIVCSSLLLIISYQVVCHPVKYEDLDNNFDEYAVYEMLNKLNPPSIQQYIPPRDNYYDLSESLRPAIVRGKKNGITAGDIASYLATLSRDRNSQSANDKIKGQRFGISK